MSLRLKRLLDPIPINGAGDGMGERNTSLFGRKPDWMGEMLTFCVVPLRDIVGGNGDNGFIPPKPGVGSFCPRSGDISDGDMWPCDAIAIDGREGDTFGENNACNAASGGELCSRRGSQLLRGVSFTLPRLRALSIELEAGVI